MKRENHQKSKKGFSKWISNLLNLTPQNKDDLIELFHTSQQKQILDPDTFNMIEGVLDIAQQRVRDIMIPRTQIITIKNNFTLNECLQVIFKHGHSRYPVISEDKDHIEGILLAKDLICHLQTKNETFDLKSIIRPATVVPESKRVDRMLKEFRMQRYHMAIVIDEFGGVSGLVTIEDILELIVGEIDDEYDEIEEGDIKQISPKEYVVSALTMIEVFNAAFKTTFNDDDLDTIGGIVMQQFGRLPIKGESTIIDNLTFKVALTDKNRITQVHVILPDGSYAPEIN